MGIYRMCVCVCNVCVCEYICVVSLSNIEKIIMRLTKLAFWHTYTWHCSCGMVQPVLQPSFIWPSGRYFLDVAFSAPPPTPLLHSNLIQYIPLTSALKWLRQCGERKRKKEYFPSEFDSKPKIVSSEWGATTPEMKLYVLWFHLIFCIFLMEPDLFQNVSSECVVAP